MRNLGYVLLGLILLAVAGFGSGIVIEQLIPERVFFSLLGPYHGEVVDEMTRWILRFSWSFLLAFFGLIGLSFVLGAAWLVGNFVASLFSAR